MSDSVRVGHSGLAQAYMKAIEENDLLTWVIYEFPSDFPTSYVIRPHSVKRKAPLPLHFEHPQLAFARSALRRLGLTCLARDSSDDPCILETWV